MHIIKEIIISQDKPDDKVLLVYKDIGETSHDVVDKVRKIYGTRKVGHAGALDPFAKGMLIVGIHNGTKAIWKFEDQVKGYNFEMILGIKTLSGDHQEKIIDVGVGPDNIGIPTQTNLENESYSNDTIKSVFQNFPKNYSQQVPLLSSVKVHGHKLRELVRSCKDVQIIGNNAIFTMHDGKIIELEIPSKNVVLEKLELKSISQVGIDEILETASEDFSKSITEYNLEDVKLTKISGYAEVSKGTFIRKLAEDIAEKLGTFAFLCSLERVKCGEYTL